VMAGLRDRMHVPETRQEEMAKLEGMGVKGIKVDFMQSDKQYLMLLYMDILRDAARHTCWWTSTAPRAARLGPHFPNLATQEGIRGAEQYWDPVFAENAHTYHTIYTFTATWSAPWTTPGHLRSGPELQWHKTTNATSWPSPWPSRAVSSTSSTAPPPTGASPTTSRSS